MRRRVLLISFVLSGCFTPVAEFVPAPPKVEPIPTARCKGTGRFTLTRSLPIGLATAVAAGDLNEDGRQDLVVSIFDEVKRTSTVALVEGHGDGSFSAPAALLESRGANSALGLHDVDADGHLDLLQLVQFDADVQEEPGLLRVSRGLGGARFAAPLEHVAGARPWQLVVAHLDDDGVLDLAVGNYGLCFDFANLPSSVKVFWGMGHGQFAGGPELSDATQWEGLSAGDLDGDGIAELTVMRTTWTGDCRMSSSSTATLEVLSASSRRLTIRETRVLDHTALAEALVLPIPGMAPSIAVVDWGVDVYRPGSSGLEAVQSIGWEPDFVFNRAVTADFDGDGRGDIAAAQMDRQSVAVFLTQGDGLLGPVLESPARPAQRAIIAHDFDSDGATDLVTLDTEAGVLELLHNVCK